MAWSTTLLKWSLIITPWSVNQGSTSALQKHWHKYNCACWYKWLYLFSVFRMTSKHSRLSIAGCKYWFMLKYTVSYILHKSQGKNLNYLQSGISHFHSFSVEDRGLHYYRILIPQKSGEIYCCLVVVAQWQSACALYKRSWVGFPVATKYF